MAKSSRPRWLVTGLPIGDHEAMPRFVLLHHECPPSFGKPSHWDLMLERDGVLLTWSLPALPAAWGGEGGAAEQIAATRLADHRLAYLDYEGSISGDRGVVTRVDGGEYEVLEETEQAIRIRLQGEEPHEVVVMLSL